MGLKDVSTINKVLRGQREPGPLLVDRLCDYFTFNKRESEYFNDLVALAKEKDNTRNRIYIMERLKESHPNPNFRELNLDEFNCISKWYCYAIREMVKLKDFKEDFAWIASRLRFSVKHSEMEDALLSLLKLNLLSRDSEGKLFISNPSYQSSNDIASEALKQFHEGVIGLAKKSIREVPLEERHVIGYTICVSDAQIARAKQLIDQQFDRLSSNLETDSGDQIYQMNVQFFPLTKKKKV